MYTIKRRISLSQEEKNSLELGSIAHHKKTQTYTKVEPTYNKYLENTKKIGDVHHAGCRWWFDENALCYMFIIEVEPSITLLKNYTTEQDAAGTISPDMKKFISEIWPSLKTYLDQNHYKKSFEEPMEGLKKLFAIFLKE